MTLWEHLAELRRRLIICAVAVALGALAGWFLYDLIVEVLQDPYCRIVDDPDVEGCGLYVTDPLQPFAIRLRIAGYGGIALAMPVILWQIWGFVTPGLYPHERRYAIPFVGASLVLFVLGAGIAYYTLPQALGFLGAIGGENLTEIYTIDRYLHLITYMMLAFGVGFEFPVLLVALQLIGVITPQQLASWRRMAIVVIVVLAAVITPSGDPISLLALSGPMYLFYELSILIGWLFNRRRDRPEVSGEP
jgi:sec-independent protein translocase protein TatC